MGYIYKITNLINQKSYIGQTVYFNERIKQHQRNSFNPNSIDYDVPIHRAIRKYGIENFSYEIIEEVDEKLLNNREIYWISYYDTYFNGYNATLGGEGRQRYSLTQIIELWNNGYSIADIANTLGCNRVTVRVNLEEAGISIEERQKRRIKPVYQYDLKGFFLKRWNSSQEAAENFNGTANTIQCAARGKRKGAYGYLWRYSYLPNILPFTDLRGAAYKEEEILDFIHRRFPKNCNWTNGNCYWFAWILNQRFPLSEIVYDSLTGHFLCKICKQYYDYNGKIDVKEKAMPLWLIQLKDYLWYEHLMRDCMM